MRWSHADRGLRYRVVYPVPGMARRSVAVPNAKLAVFMDGCFWQGWPEHDTQPRANSDWWAAKLQRNKCNMRRPTT
uniref:Very short patch repair endonuclease n=1 Tax=Neobacillus citreus TaxID=2833578 RepID=A0A942T1K6_9BACI